MTASKCRLTPLHPQERQPPPGGPTFTEGGCRRNVRPVSGLGPWAQRTGRELCQRQHKTNPLDYLETVIAGIPSAIETFRSLGRDERERELVRPKPQ